jgi:pimeloyl-ACP methyl ester carboxylesterase
LHLLVERATSAKRKTPGNLQWVQTRLPAPEGLVFIPPLIGGGPAQQLGTFRWLCKYNLDLFSFDYTGHGGSTGKFSLADPVTDTRRMLSLAAGRAQTAGLPLFGIAACYATIPMLLGALTTAEPFKKVVLINPLTAFFQGTFLQAMVRYCKAGFDISRPASSLKASVNSYLDLLFPDISRGPAGFGALSRKRTRVLKVLVEWFAAKIRLDFSLPQTPALCIYSRRDPILNLGGGAPRSASMDCLRKVCSPVTFHAINSDHFLSDPKSRAITRRTIRSFLLTG